MYVTSVPVCAIEDSNYSTVKQVGQMPGVEVRESDGYVFILGVTYDLCAEALSKALGIVRDDSVVADYDIYEDCNEWLALPRKCDEFVKLGLIGKLLLIRRVTVSSYPWSKSPNYHLMYGTCIPHEKVVAIGHRFLHDIADTETVQYKIIEHLK